MQQSNSLLSEIELRMKDLKSVHMNRISAVPISLYSDLPEDSIWYHSLVVNKSVRNNPLSLCCLLVLISKYNPYWYTEFVLFCANQSKRYKYKGKWMLLHKLAKLYHHSLIMYRISESISGNEFFGNWYPTIVKMSEDCPVRFIKLTKKIPKQIQRKRGYNDKGSRKLEHEKHDFSVSSEPNPEKLDFTGSYKKRNFLVNFLYG